ncbi:A24 family peptidase [Nesterenkonia sp.]|uniref:prepilin peptidase n=1 Tax=Nesterenkonia sp. TaxID=704201 RepID=UPI002613C569|nr:A24 family peptidase [Nesterenkonia sp.]
MVITDSPWPAKGAPVVFAATGPLLAAIDWRERRLPDIITLPLAAACFVVLLSSAVLSGDFLRLAMAVACSVGSVLFFFVLFVLAPSQLGFGDVKLMLSAGLVLGWHGPVVTVMGIVMGLLFGLLYGVVQIVRGRAHRRSHIALGPHLIAGTLVLGLLLY